MSRGSIWQVLGIKRTRDRAEIRRAYARRLKETNPEDDPDGFKALRNAYEAALSGAGDARPNLGRSSPFPIILHEDTDEEQPGDAEQAEIPADSEPKREREPGRIEAVIADTLAPEPLPVAQAVEPEPRPEPKAESKPAPPPDPRIAHGRAQEALARLLRRKDARDEAILDAYNAVVESPAMDAIDVHSDTEDWLAFLIATQAPRSDALIGPAMKRFRWNDGSLHRRDQFHIQHIQRRLNDLAFLRGVKLPQSPHHGAYKILSRPFQPISLFHRFFSRTSPSMVADLIAEVRSRHPSLLADLNSDTVERWEAWQDERPHLPTWGLWTLAATPLCLLTILLDHFLLPEVWHAISMLLIIPPAFAAAALVNTFGFELPRHLWARQGYDTPAWIRLGWGPALVLVLVLAALPAQTWSIVPVGVCALAVAIWAIASGRVDQIKRGWVPWRLRAALTEGYLMVWWVACFAAVPRLDALQASVGVLLAACVSAYGRLPAYEFWLRLRRPWRLGLCVFWMVAAVGAVFELFASAHIPNLRAPAVCAVATLVVMHRPLTAQVGSWSYRLRWFTMIGMVNIGLFGGRSSLLAVGGIALLVWAGVVVGQALVREIQSPRIRM